MLHGHDLHLVLEEFGSPLYVYSQPQLTSSCRALLAALSPHASLVYSIKVNGNPHLVAEICRHGLDVEAASAGEIVIALKAGLTPERIFFGGPGKTPAEIAFAVEKGVGVFNAESVREVERISETASASGVTQRVLLRVNPSLTVTKARIRMGGAPRQFGLDEEEVSSCLPYLLTLPGVRVAGLFVYMGTQILDVDSIVLTTGHLLDLAARLSGEHGLVVETLDFGGGFGVPYFSCETELDLAGLQGRLDDLFTARRRNEPSLRRTRFVFESGRYVLARAGFYLTRVVDIKTSRGRTFVIADGGMNHNAASAGIGRVMREETPIMLLREESEEAERNTVTVVGPTCTPVDVLHSNLPVGRVEVGDIIAVPLAGAYGLALSPVYFCAHPTPAEVLVTAGGTRLIRRRGTLEELLWNTEL